MRQLAQILLFYQLKNVQPMLIASAGDGYDSVCNDLPERTWIAHKKQGLFVNLLLALSFKFQKNTNVDSRNYQFIPM